MLWRNILFPAYNRSLAVVIGAFYFLYAWVLQSADDHSGASLLTQLASLPVSVGSVRGVVLAYANQLLYRPAGAALLVALVAALVSFAQPNGNGSPLPGWAKKLVAGTVHGGLHIALLSLVMWIYARYGAGVAPAADSSWSLPVYGSVVFAGGAVLGGMLFGIYLLASNRWFGFHRTEAFSSFRGTDCKSFLRMHVSADGLTVYPVHIDSVATAWRTRGDSDQSRSWVQPVNGIACRLGKGFTIRP